MKKILFGIAIMTMTSSLFGQARVNRQKISFINQSEKITKATGWAYNATLGEWIDYENVICQDKDYKTKYKSLRSYMMSRRSQNFLNIQFKTVSLDSNTYFVLMVEKWQGRYKYPSIREDWHLWKETFGYIFTESQYDKIKSSDSIVELKAQYQVSLGSNYEKYDEVKFLDLIQTELKSGKSKYLKYIFPIKKTNVDGQNLVRFFVPVYFSSYSNNDFEKEYFEIAQIDFDKIMIK